LLESMNDIPSSSAVRQLVLRLYLSSENRTCKYFSEIDRINVLQASMLAMKNSIEELLALNSDFLLSNADLCYAVVDGNKCPNKLPIKSKPVVRGDALVYSIALASIVAKVERDHFMVSYSNLEHTPTSNSTN
jgi:ribonuclease HII